jgi:MFS family permease
MVPGEDDPLWRLRHALAGVSLALLLSVLLAALGGSWLAGWLDDRYAVRVTLYAALLAYVVAGAVVLFVRVAQHETQPLSARRVGLWLVSLWMWPLLWRSGRNRPPPA